MDRSQSAVTFVGKTRKKIVTVRHSSSNTAKPCSFSGICFGFVNLVMYTHLDSQNGDVTWEVPG